MATSSLAAVDGFQMNINPRVRLFAITFLVTFSLSRATAHAEDFVSQKYGFRFSVPAGFHEQVDNAATRIKTFAETDEGKDFPIVILFDHTGQEVFPTADIDPSQLPHVEGWKFSVESSRWQKIRLPAIRREAPSGANGEIFVAYIIQFPLKGEAVQLLVQGSKNREQEARKVFDESVRSFVNIKPYLINIELTRPGKVLSAVRRYLITILLFSATGAALFFLMNKLRTLESKSPHVAGPQAPTTNMLRAQRPTGVMLLAILQFLIGIFFIYQPVSTVVSVTRSAAGSVIFGEDFIAHALAQFICASISISSGIGLCIGTKWGWWLGAIHWAWRLSWQALLPISLALMIREPIESIGREDTSKVAFSLVFYSLLLLYMFTYKVLDYVEVGRLHQRWALLGILCAGMILSICFPI